MSNPVSNIISSSGSLLFSAYTIYDGCKEKRKIESNKDKVTRAAKKISEKHPEVQSQVEHWSLKMAKASYSRMKASTVNIITGVCNGVGAGINIGINAFRIAGRPLQESDLVNQILTKSPYVIAIGANLGSGVVQVVAFYEGAKGYFYANDPKAQEYYSKHAFNQIIQVLASASQAFGATVSLSTDDSLPYAVVSVVGGGIAFLSDKITRYQLKRIVASAPGNVELRKAQMHIHVSESVVTMAPLQIAADELVSLQTCRIQTPISPISPSSQPSQNLKPIHEEDEVVDLPVDNIEVEDSDSSDDGIGMGKF